MKNGSLCQAVVGLSLLGAGGFARADDAVVTKPENAAEVTGKSLVRVPTSGSTMAMWVDAPEARSSAAARDRTDEAVFAGGVAPGPEDGYTLYASVIVRTDDADAVGLLVGGMTQHAATITAAGKPGTALGEFWIVECVSVAQAVELAFALRDAAAVREAYVDMRSPLSLRDELPTDPEFGQQWSMHNTTVPAFDANLAPAWKAGITGAGVTVAVAEFGWVVTHPDLAAKFNSDASQPGAGWQSHGTSVAGIVGMIANNGIGGAGAAYGAGLSKLYVGSSTVIAAAFEFRNDLNHVKNNSWGPTDNGVARVMPSIEAAALADAVASGRGGLGTVFVWACGNGGTGVDRVDYDPYASSRFSIAVGSIDSQDRRALYSEPGSSLLVVTQSDYDLNSSSDPGIYSTSGADTYTTNFGGTSAAAPLASGVVALMLEANPLLTWRDVQHVLVRSARMCRPLDLGWRANDAGLSVNDNFGFGAIDAGAAVALAQSWTSVDAEAQYDTGTIAEGSVAIPDNNTTGLTRTVLVPSHFRIESVELVLNASHNSCGQLRVSITAPGGLQSLLANTRTDNANTYSGGYTFTSMKHFGERAAGNWQLKVSDGTAGTIGQLNSWRLRFHGTVIDCPCDWDADGQVGVPDIFAYLSSWFDGTGDFDLNGVNEVPDIFGFLGCWFAGPCP